MSYYGPGGRDVNAPAPERVGFPGIEENKAQEQSRVVVDAMDEAARISDRLGAQHETFVMEMQHLRERASECAKASDLYNSAADSIQNFLSGSSIKEVR